MVCEGMLQNLQYQEMSHLDVQCLIGENYTACSRGMLCRSKSRAATFGSLKGQAARTDVIALNQAAHLTGLRVLEADVTSELPSDWIILRLLPQICQACSTFSLRWPGPPLTST